MDRVRVRVKDKRVCALVKALLKSGVLTELGDREESHTGTLQGGIISPLLANIALSALDDHFDQQWQQQMPTEYQRAKRRRNGKANYKFIRYADLCRARHKSAYAEALVMPTPMSDALVRAVGGFLLSA
jgi:RNA-directed DNA polymerase